MQQNPSSEADSSSLSGEAPCISCNLKFHFHAQKSYTLLSVLSTYVMSTDSQFVSLTSVLILSVYMCMKVKKNGIEICLV